MQTKAGMMINTGSHEMASFKPKMLVALWVAAFISKPSQPIIARPNAPPMAYGILPNNPSMEK